MNARYTKQYCLFINNLAALLVVVDYTQALTHPPTKIPKPKGLGKYQNVSKTALLLTLGFLNNT
jgi:hypothetical protein